MNLKTTNMKLVIENITELNVLAVALDHLEEHLMSISDEVGVEEKLKAVWNLQARTLKE